MSSINVRDTPSQRGRNELQDPRVGLRIIDEARPSGTFIQVGPFVRLAKISASCSDDSNALTSFVARKNWARALGSHLGVTCSGASGQEG